MGIDSVKSGISSLVQSVQQQVEAKLQELTPAAAPPPAAAKPTETFSDAKKRPLSLSGEPTPAQVTGSVARADLAADVASLRRVAGSGAMGAAGMALAMGRQEAAAPTAASLGTAIERGHDAEISAAINQHPELLKELSLAQRGKALESLRAGYTSDADEAAMVAIVRSCETKGELRDVMKAAAGADWNKQLHSFDSEMTGHHPYLIADLLNPDNRSLPELHPDSISANEHVDGPGAYPKVDMNDAVSLKPGDEAARKQFLSTLTQVDAKRTGQKDDYYETEPRQYGCGPLCIVASAMQGPDPQGALSKLCDYNLKNMTPRYGTERAKEDATGLEDLKRRLAAGEPVTRGDMDLLQRTTYNAARNREAAIAGSTSTNEAIDQRAILEVLDNSGVGRAGGVPQLVDNDRVMDRNGKRSADHFVLVKDGAVYDPWPRKDGAQLVPAGSDSAKRYLRSVVE